MEFDTYGYIETPGMFPKVSYLIMDIGRRLIREKIWEPYRIGDKFPATKKWMDVFVSTGKQMRDHQEVWGPIKKRGCIEFILWIPFDRLAEHENHLVPFLKYYYDGMVQVFAHYGVPEEAIRAIQKEVEAETIGNLEYEYIELYPWHHDKPPV